jgi:hypothetical protein
LYKKQLSEQSPLTLKTLNEIHIISASFKALSSWYAVKSLSNLVLFYEREKFDYLRAFSFKLELG